MPHPPKLPNGFRYSGAACGIKQSGKPDLSLIVTDRPVVGVGVYTQNQIVAAPVVLCRKRTPSSSIRAVVTNSGNANACTGLQGDLNAEEMTRRLAEMVGCAPSDVLVMSTGVIGHPLPMENIRTGIEASFQALDRDEEAFQRSADAILTTDVERKIAFDSVTIEETTYRIAAMAKGAGMIAPNMATMLAVVTTDAPLSEAAASKILSHAVDRSFNRVSVDGHTSTNDTLLLLASGEGETLQGDDLETMQTKITQACIELARMLVADGEGASHTMAITINGARSDQDAFEIAKSVAASPLVKTAITGGDPNWGRIVSAAGYAGPIITPNEVSLRIFDTVIYQDGTPVECDEAALSEQMKQTETIEIHLTVGSGSGSTKYWSSDLTTQYVKFNSEYTT